MPEIAWYLPAAAFLLDFYLGDPAWLPHPVVGMGNAVLFFESRFRKLKLPLLVSGFLFALFLVAGVFIMAWGVIAAFNMINPLLGAALQVLLLFFCFSSRTLEKEAMNVARSLKSGSLPEARKMVARIVGRETAQLDRAGISRACVETVAENFVDGFVSPLFFFMIGGVPAALAYKMVNTLDSMVGYRNEKYLYFGRGAARLDDVANFIPARLSVFVIALAGIILAPRSGWAALKTAVTEGHRHKSPNAGYPEASFSGALQVRMGGPSVYHGSVLEKPFIGRRFSDPDLQHIQKACELMMFSTYLAILISSLALFLFYSKMVPLY